MFDNIVILEEGTNFKALHFQILLRLFYKQTFLTTLSSHEFATLAVW